MKIEVKKVKEVMRVNPVAFFYYDFSKNLEINKIFTKFEL